MSLTAGWVNNFQQVTWQREKLSAMQEIPLARAKLILDFWFGQPVTDEQDRPGVNPAQIMLWFRDDKEFKGDLDRQFEIFLTYYNAKKLESWKNSVEGCVALFIILDQFPRKLYAGSRQAFDWDAEAQGLARACQANGLYNKIKAANFVWAMFALYPFLNSEVLEDQVAGAALQQALATEAKGGNRGNWGWIDSMKLWFKNNKSAIEQFGRFPDRNIAVGRPSTTAEIKALHRGLVVGSKHFGKSRKKIGTKWVKRS